MSTNDKRPPKAPRFLEQLSDPAPRTTLIPGALDPLRKNPVKLALQPTTGGKGFGHGPSSSTLSSNGRVAQPGTTSGFGIIPSNSSARAHVSSTVEKAFDVGGQSPSRGMDDHSAPTKHQEASNAYPTPNTPPQTAPSSSPARPPHTDDSSSDPQSAPPPPPPSEPPPPLPSPLPFEREEVINAPPSPPPTDTQPSPPPDDSFVTVEVEKKLPEGPPPPPPFETVQIRGWKMIYDPKLEGLASKDKSRPTERRHNGEAGPNQGPIVVVDPRLAMPEEQRLGMKGRRPHRPKLYTFKSYEWDTDSPGPRPFASPRAILITNLSPVTPTAFVRRFFGQYGRIDDFDWEVDLYTGNPLGVCWIQYAGDDYVEGEGQKCAKKALENANGVRVGQGQEGQIVKIYLDRQKKRCKALVKSESDRRRKERQDAKAKAREPPSSSSASHTPTVPPAAVHPSLPARPKVDTPSRPPATSSSSSSRPSVTFDSTPSSIPSSSKRPIPPPQPMRAVSATNGPALTPPTVTVTAPPPPPPPLHPSLPQRPQFAPTLPSPVARPDPSLPSWEPPPRDRGRGGGRSPNRPGKRFWERSPDDPRDARPSRPDSDWRKGDSYTPYRQRAPRRDDALEPSSHSRHHYRPPTDSRRSHHSRHWSRSSSRDSRYDYDHDYDRSRSHTPNRYRRSRSRSRSDSRSGSPSRSYSPAPRHYSRGGGGGGTSSRSPEDDRRDRGRPRARDWRRDSSEPTSPVEEGMHAEVEAALAANGHEYILISKSSLARSSHAEEDVKNFFLRSNFFPEKVMYDSAGWYITFKSPTAARRASMVLDRQKIYHHTINLVVRPPYNSQSAEAAPTTSSEAPLPTASSALPTEQSRSEVLTQAHALVIEYLKEQVRAELRGRLIRERIKKNISEWPENKEKVKAKLAAAAAKRASSSKPANRLAGLKFTKKPGSESFRAKKKQQQVKEPTPEPALERESSMVRVLPASKRTKTKERDASPSPTPVRKRRKMKTAVDVGFESEDETPLGTAPTSSPAPRDPTPVPTEKRQRSPSLTAAPVSSRKKRKVETATPTPMEEDAASTVLDDDVDAMLMEHLDSAPTKKPKTGGRKKKAQKTEPIFADIDIPNAGSEPLAELAGNIDMVIDEVPEESAPIVQEIEEPPKPTPKKRVRQPKKAKAEPVAAPAPVDPGPPPNPTDFAQDEEELYFLKLGLQRRLAGQPEWGVDLRDPAEIAAEREANAKRHAAIRVHSTGSARTEGYYKIPEAVKALYLPDRNQAKIDVGPASAVPAGASSRSTRIESRHLARDVEQTNRLLASLGHGDSASDTRIKFNQLRTRKKRLRFARSPIHDWGLYALEAIAIGEMVIEYVGEVIRQQVADKREKYYEQTGIGSSYLFRVDDDAVVDATKKGNLGRLINHCCAPNCTAKIITINGDKKIVIYAKTAIEPGDEITYDYHFPIENEKIICLCGSPKCRGFLN